MSRLNTSAEVISEVTEVGIMTDVATTPGDTTVDSAASQGDTSLTVASGTNWANGDKFRIGDRPLIEAGEIESGGGTTSWTLKSELGAGYAVGEVVYEVEDTPIGDLTEEGIRVVVEGGENPIRSGSYDGVYTYLRSGDAALYIEFALLNLSMENIAEMVGEDPSTRIAGAGTAVDPYTVDLKTANFGEQPERIWYFTGARVDGGIIRVEGNGGKIFAPNDQLAFSQGTPAELGFRVRLAHGVRVIQYS